MDQAIARTRGPAPADLGMLDVVDLSIGRHAEPGHRYRLAAYPPDLLITVPRTACRTLDFHKANELIALGRQSAIESLAAADTFPPSQTGNDSNDAW